MEYNCDCQKSNTLLKAIYNTRLYGILMNNYGLIMDLRIQIYNVLYNSIYYNFSQKYCLMYSKLTSNFTEHLDRVGLQRVNRLGYVKDNEQSSTNQGEIFLNGYLEINIKKNMASFVFGFE